MIIGSQFRPMLAAKIPSHIQTWEIPLPKLATPKIDGIRCITQRKIMVDMFNPATVQCVGRSLLPIPNKHIQQVIGSWGLPDLDGELLTWSPQVGSEELMMDSYHMVQSKIMSEHGEPAFSFHVFDIVDPRPYWDRMAFLKENITCTDPHFRKTLPVLIQEEKHLLAYEEACLQQGFEGIMLRDIDGPYKYGRSTWKEQYLIKVKRFKDAEATVIGFEELEHNENEQTIGPLGLIERSDHKAGKVAGGTLGAIVVCGHNGIKFKIGSGFDAATRQRIWDNQSEYLHRLVSYRYQPHGVKEAPRCPIFKGFRDPVDMDGGEGSLDGKSLI
jgi:DNA ligase-1